MKPVLYYQRFFRSERPEFINFTLDQPYFRAPAKPCLLLWEGARKEEYDLTF